MIVYSHPGFIVFATDNGSPDKRALALIMVVYSLSTRTGTSTEQRRLQSFWKFVRVNRLG